MDESVAPPYAPAANIIKIIHQWRDRTIPEQVTREWMERISLSENLASRNLHALAFLGLTDGAGFPQSLAERLRVASAEEYQAELESIIRRSYSRIFDIVDPSTASRLKVEDAFRKEKPDGQRSRMVACFLGLCKEAGIELKEPPQGGRRLQKARFIALPRKPPPEPSDAPPTPTVPAELPAFAPLRSDVVLFHPAIDAFLREARKLTTGETWTQQARDGFVQAFTNQLDLFLPVRKGD